MIKVDDSVQDWLNARACVVVTLETFHSVCGDFEAADAAFTRRYEELIARNEMLQRQLDDAEKARVAAEQRLFRVLDLVSRA